MIVTLGIFLGLALAQQPAPTPQPDAASLDPHAPTSALSDANIPTSGPSREPIALSAIPNAVDAELRLDRNTLPVGNAVMGEFILRNKTLTPVTLQIPGAEVSHDEFAAMGLPIEHIFSGDRYRALRVAAEGNATLGDRKIEKPEYPVPLLTIAPMASVGLRIDLARLYPVLHQPGKYELSWSPYFGAISAPPVTLDVITYKTVAIETTHGRLMLRLLYDEAPNTVDNFLDLIRARFYDGKTFHRVERDFAIAGGCPVGNGTGRRPDGRTIPPEFNKTPFTLGTVGMSLAPNDPNSASCQFFITLGRAENLDGKYTAFAQVEGPESLDTLRRIAGVELDARKRPVQPVKIKTATILDASAVR